MMKFFIATLAILLVVLVNSAICRPQHGPGRPGHGHRHPPICKVMNGTEILCDKSQNCSYFSTCEKGRREHEGELDFYFCRPKICYEEKDGEAKSTSCPAGLTCVEGRHKGPDNTVIRVCLPPDIGSGDHDDADEHKGRGHLCEHPKTEGRDQHHGPRGRRPPICKVMNETTVLCDKSGNCPNFTTCVTGEKGRRGGLQMYICKPKVCTDQSECSGDLVCREGRRGRKETKYCLPQRPEDDGSKDRERQRDRFCSPRGRRPS